MTPATLSSQLGTATAPQLIDVREPSEFAGGRIPGALLIPLGTLPSRAGEIDIDRPAVMICHSGKRSTDACEELHSLGYSKLHNLEGGMVAWKAGSHPTEKDQRAPWALDRQVRFAAGLLLLLGLLSASYIHHRFIWLTWAVAAGLLISSWLNWCGMGLLLAKMPWNQPRDCRR